MDKVDPIILRKLWEGSLPLEIEMDQQDLITLGATSKVNHQYMLAMRCSYLPLLTSAVRKYFIEQGELTFIGDDADIWYEYQGVPLKWHLPIGLLYDLHVLARSSADSNHQNPSSSQFDHQSLPWKIKVHFTQFPYDKLIQIQSQTTMDAPHDYFMSMVKEADYLRNGSIKRTMSLSKQDQLHLWQGLSAGDYTKFWNVNTKLLSFDSFSAPPKYIPLRLYLPNQPVIQELLSPVDGSTIPGREVTVGEAVIILLERNDPDFQRSIQQNPNSSAIPSSSVAQNDTPTTHTSNQSDPKSPTPNANHPSTPTNAAPSHVEEGGPSQRRRSLDESKINSDQTVLTDHENDLKIHTDHINRKTSLPAMEIDTHVHSSSPKNTNIDTHSTKQTPNTSLYYPSLTPYSVILHGIQLPFETPLIWCCQNMNYADNFIHLVVGKKMEQ